MNDPSFFGYGSLVNLKTHSYPNPRRATVKGWRRIWRSVRDHEHALLSVRPEPDTTISGIIADVPGADWAALDAREVMYKRQELTETTAIYEIRTNVIWPKVPHPILRSYLDVVVAGYLKNFGAEGVADFFATTDNWGPVKDDRAAPLYPRHQQVKTEVTVLVDQHLAAQV